MNFIFSALILIPIMFAQIMGISYHHVYAPAQAHYAGNGCFGGVNGTASTTCTITGVATGQVIFIDAAQFNATVTGVTDTGTGTITHIVGPTTFNSGSGLDDAWVITGTSAGTHAVKVTYSVTAGYPRVMGLVVSGANATTPVDSIISTDIVASSTCASVTASTANELMLSFIHGSGSVYTVGTTPQLMTTTAYNATTGDQSDYGYVVHSGANFTHWGLTTPGGDSVCTTIMVKH